MTTARRPVSIQTRTETRNVQVNVIVIDYYPRCMFCKYQPILIGMATRPWAQQCRHCKKINYSSKDETR